jgi:hypothetical protein
MPHLEYSDEELNLGPNWDVDPDSNQPLSPRIRQQLRRALVAEHENKDLKARVEAQERVESFRKAGIPSDAKGDLFAKSYEGPDDPTSLKTAYESIFGTIEAPNGTSTGTTPDPQNADAARRVADAGAKGAGSGGAPGDIDLAVGMEQAFNEGGTAGLKAFIAANGAFSSPQEIDGRLVHGIKLPDID